MALSEQFEASAGTNAQAAKMAAKPDVPANSSQLPGIEHLNITTLAAKAEENLALAKTIIVLMESSGLDINAIMGGMAVRSAAFETVRLAMRQERQAKERDADAFLLAILAREEIGVFIGDQIFGQMSDSEISAVVGEIETKTGDSFEAYAEKILGDDVPQRQGGETDADYQRRVLQAITEEIIDPATGRVKPEYEDDPVARIIGRDEVYREILAAVEDINTRTRETGVTAETKREVNEQSASANAANVMRAQLEETELVTVANEQDKETRAADTASLDDFSENTGKLDQLGAMDGRLAEASADFSAQFTQALGNVGIGPNTADNELRPNETPFDLSKSII